MIDRVCKIAAGAGEVILRYYKRSIQVSTKEDRSPLSEADRASHDYLVAALQSLTPGWTVISEESKADQTLVQRSNQYWLVDPLDGTKEFLKGTDEFTVNIALIDSGLAVLGVVFAPALGITYFADASGGAWRQEGRNPARAIRTRAADARRLAIVASKDHSGTSVAALLAKVPGAQLKSMGSSLKFCLVAEGTADLYLRDIPTMEWDTAAAQCVVEAAGGAVCELDGSRLLYSKPGLRNRSLMTVGDPQLDWKSLLD
jgi:3'(2'), 5'-bisphosphate nucleotidase